jgi:lysophospholipase L1-like esterase
LGDAGRVNLPPADSLTMKSPAKLVFLGDSITDAGRSPAGEFAPWPGDAGLGHGYVSLVHAHLQANHPGKRLRVLNRGVGGSTIRDVAARWSEDVDTTQPDWISLGIGINDVWRQFDTPLTPEKQVPLGEYRRTLDELMARARQAKIRVALITPFMIEPRRADPMRRRMDEYSTAVRAAARRHGAILVDVQKEFDGLLRHCHSASLAWDRIHVGTPGHLLIAQTWLRACGFRQRLQST